MAHLDGKLSVDEIRVLKDQISKLTWHSARVTLLNAAVHGKKDASAIAVQANWADTTLVLKYARDRRTVSLAMVNELVAEMRGGWTPQGDPVDYEEDLFLDDDVPKFFTKIPKATRANFKVELLKWHVSHRDDLTKTQCGIPLVECDPMGTLLAHVGVLCNRCLSSRPELGPRV